MEATQTGLEIELDGEKYHMEPLTDADYAELDSWVQSRFIANAYAAARDLPDKEFDRVVALAMSKSLGMSWLVGDGKRAVATVAGYSMMLWLGIRHRHPDVTYEKVRAGLLMDRKSVSYARALFTRVNFPKQEAANGSANPPPSPVETPSTPA